MNHGKILARAWTLMWHARALWVFGFLFALAGGGGWQSARGTTSSGTGNGAGNGFGPFPHIPLSQINWGTVAWIATAVLAVLLVLGVVVTIVRYLAETALMA